MHTWTNKHIRTILHYYLRNPQTYIENKARAQWARMRRLIFTPSPKHTALFVYLNCNNAKCAHHCTARRPIYYYRNTIDPFKIECVINMAINQYISIPKLMGCFVWSWQQILSTGIHKPQTRLIPMPIS